MPEGVERQHAAEYENASVETRAAEVDALGRVADSEPLVRLAATSARQTGDSAVSHKRRAFTIPATATDGPTLERMLP